MGLLLAGRGWNNRIFHIYPIGFFIVWLLVWWLWRPTWVVRHNQRQHYRCNSGLSLCTDLEFAGYSKWKPHWVFRESSCNWCAQWWTTNSLCQAGRRSVRQWWWRANWWTRHSHFEHRNAPRHRSNRVVHRYIRGGFRLSNQPAVLYQTGCARKRPHRFGHRMDHGTR